MRLELLAGGETTVAEFIRALSAEDPGAPDAPRGCGGTLEWWMQATRQYVHNRDRRRLRALESWDQPLRSA